MEHIFGLTIASLAVSATAIWALLCLAGPLFWLWMFVDSLLRYEEEYPGGTATSNNKLLWVLLIILTQIAVIPYFFMVYSKVRRGAFVRPVPATPAG